MLFQDVDHISYDNAQRQLRGIRKFIDKIKKENNNIVLEKQNSSGAYQGAKYFSYNGKVLDDLRKEMEKE